VKDTIQLDVKEEEEDLQSSDMNKQYCSYYISLLLITNHGTRHLLFKTFKKADLQLLDSA
jgi:hypothetical protein